MRCSSRRFFSEYNEECENVGNHSPVAARPPVKRGEPGPCDLVRSHAILEFAETKTMKQRIRKPVTANVHGSNGSANRIVLVGTYKGDQLAKWRGWYNYPISEEDQIAEADAASIAELWLFKGTKEQKTYKAEAAYQLSFWDLPQMRPVLIKENNKRMSTNLRQSEAILPLHHNDNVGSPWLKGKTKLP